MEIELAVGWREVAPRVDAPSMLIEEAGRLQYLKSDFSLCHDLGLVGPVECPIALDPASRTAYRYVCAAGFGGKDFSQLRAYDLASGRVRSIIELPLNKWVLWLLEWLEGRDESSGQLLGLLATDRPMDDRIVIEHQLFALQPSVDHQPRVRPICRDAYKPLAFSRQRREFVFSGAEGIYIVGLKGERRATLSLDAGPTGHGAAFDPSGAGRVVLGGDGLYLWDLAAGSCRQLVRQARHPVWSHDGRGIWFRESSSDLYYYNLAEDRVEKVLATRSHRYPEVWAARPAQQSVCGRYLALSLQTKKLKGISRKANAAGTQERVYQQDQAICILDLERRELWRREGFFNQFCWAGSSGGTH